MKSILGRKPRNVKVEKAQPRLAAKRCCGHVGCCGHIKCCGHLSCCGH